MKNIEIDDDLFAEIDKHASDLFSHSDVLRKLIRFRPSPVIVAQAGAGELPPGGQNSLVQYIASPDYKRFYNAVDQYLAVLRQLHKMHGQDFVECLTRFRRGKRVYFARTEGEIEKGGNGNLQKKKIEGSPFWALTTLDNRTKKNILRRLLIALKYSTSEIQGVLASIPDSTSRKQFLEAY